VVGAGVGPPPGRGSFNINEELIAFWWLSGVERLKKRNRDRKKVSVFKFFKNLLSVIRTSNGDYDSINTNCDDEDRSGAFGDLGDEWKRIWIRQSNLKLRQFMNLLLFRCSVGQNITVPVISLTLIRY
jgi:hypothetical protein